MARWRVAIIGCGVAGALQVERGFSLVPDRFAPAVACDQDAARCAAFAERHGIPRRAADLDEVLAMPDIDVVGPPRAVTGFKTTRVNKIEVEDCAAGALIMADGSLASLAATLGSMRPISRLRFCFENATFEREAEGEEAYRPGDEPWRVTA